MQEKVKNFTTGMGQAVAERTILRRLENGDWEKWADVADRVAFGNALLLENLKFSDSDIKKEYLNLKKHLNKANTLMSGRHLQHGDKTQPSRNMEIFTNCSTSSSSFLSFYLLMNGSGVGRCYDDDIMLVNWDYAPNLRCVISEKHPDFDFSAHESVRDAQHKYGSGRDVLWHVVEDTREGWGKALEIWENAAFQKIHASKMLILDFSNIRAKGTPIKGMQSRPASGPVPLMNAFQKAATLKGSGIERWMQAILVDHYFAECVLVGGARRAARMSVKSWRDATILDFIGVKRPIEYKNLSVDEIIQDRKNGKKDAFLWSSNNSVLVDAEFWRLLSLKKGEDGYSDKLSAHARNVFKAATESAYADGTGEPGFINQDKLVENSKGLDKLIAQNHYIGSKKYQIEEETELYVSRLLKKASKKKYYMIVNPCVAGDTWILTSDGPQQVVDLLDKPFIAVVNGKNYQATAFWKTGHKDVLKIRTKCGFEVKVTPNHEMMVIDGDNVSKWVAAGELKVGDYLVIANGMEGTKITFIEPFGKEDVYDCTVEDIHAFSANGLLAHNCSEIAIALFGAFCTIADLVPFHCDTIDEFEECARTVTRALIRVNTMDSIYNKEVKRTNRIGVGMTGVHEFAWKFFKFNFYDLLDEEKSKPFWMTLSRVRRAIRDESIKYSNELGVAIPHTDTTIKPAGTTSKLFSLTEGWHLPAMKHYMRWVQFRIGDPIVEEYRKNGYPVRELTQYKNTVIVGFPTQPIICELMGDKVVTAAEATVEEQYKWLMLGEKYWIRGVDEDGIPLKEDTGNQQSYTLKYDPEKVSFADFSRIIKEYQSQVKCCSIMPQEKNSSYEYLPEQPVSLAEYEDYRRKIEKGVAEDIDKSHIDCASGACPVDFKSKK